MTAEAAAEKKKKRDEIYYKFNSNRGMGVVQNRLRHYDKGKFVFTRFIFGILHLCSEENNNNDKVIMLI